ncbi:MBL fold metallo-hydrolase [Pedobacter sp. LMG 31464]|uniref:MBL fold metallo-hydrolase n=1 Tax=Pedobacter planticolens TaxID=2679964 RepID=A0A923DYI3_9SPHI|nr:MBL fold metallo-hydrolase [Pedobacter planticolens]MBB2144980.1 MBL fold metallo-hydrolase [Pedobacter planticolens]
MYYFILAIIFIILISVYILNLPVFGRLPKGERLKKIMNLPNYKNGAVENQSPTPALPDDVSYWMVIKEMIKGNPNSTPKHSIPHEIPDFNRSEKLKITWFGHSSYLVQVDGINILVDPVFSKRTSPFQFLGTKNFPGTDFLKIEDLPDLDIILITHDHYDHLDYASILKLKGKTSQFVTSLGVGSHLEHWGVSSNQITEMVWGEEISPLANISFTAAPARHFSGRRFKRNQTVWSSFILKTKNNKIYLGGDSGYDQHFKTIGETYGPFDLAILECGQYNEMWPLIHMFPEELVQASIDLKAKTLLPVHWGKFRLALHDWDEPIKRLTKRAEEISFPVITPKIGETFFLEENHPSSHWWINL